MYIEIDVKCERCKSYLSYEIQEDYGGTKIIVVTPCQDCINDELNHLEDSIRSQYQGEI